MALFRDEKEALRRLDAALQEDAEEDSEAYKEEFGEEFEEYDGEEPDGDDGDLEGFAPDVSHIRIRNTDRTDLDPEELTERLQPGAKRKTAAAIIALLTIAAAFLGLIFLLRYM